MIINFSILLISLFIVRNYRKSSNFSQYNQLLENYGVATIVQLFFDYRMYSYSYHFAFICLKYSAYWLESVPTVSL